MASHQHYNKMMLNDKTMLFEDLLYLVTCNMDSKLQEGNRWGVQYDLFQDTCPIVKYQIHSNNR